MPVIEYFPYRGPNRRSDKTLVEVLLKFGPADDNCFPRNVAEIRDLLINGGILEMDEVFPEQALPEERMSWYTSLLAQTALLFQRKTGHRVNYFSVSSMPGLNRCLALVEHEHCDVGMTAVKLANELMLGERRLLAEPFRMFHKFARERLLPVETEAIIMAARRREIPSIQLERNPFRREDFAALTGGRCIRPNGLLMLGHGTHQLVLDGTYCIEKEQDFAGLFEDLKKQSTSGSLTDVHPSALDPAADALLETLFPSKTPARMPIIAITGTNGKTTTTRMLNRIVSAAGYKPGMVCTDGVFLNGQLIEEGDCCTRSGHLKVLTGKAVDFAVLEAHHLGLACHGFAFYGCDVGVCLNVSEDHLGDVNIETVEQMADVKSALPERASQAAVLNADNTFSLAMLQKVTAARKCLVSMESGRDQLEERHANAMNCCCVLETDAGRQSIVLYDEQARCPVMAVDEIPACFGGSADFMVSNAMHAVAASYLSGISIADIRLALSGFQAGYESTPGRLNIFDELPFRIIMDFAHNPDGMRRVGEFAAQQTVPGRKLIAFSGSSNRADKTIRNMGRAVAGYFDFYFCKEYEPVEGKQPGQVAHILRQGLIEQGVAENQIALKTFGKVVIFEIFDTCKPGDLLVMLMGHVEKNKLPAYIQEYADVMRRRATKQT